ncbi:MAG: maleylpyruvate isomerase family mycothiol-dependent enzyme [Acidobacteriota bacterium]
MKTPEPVITVELFPDLLEELLALLGSLTADEWKRPTVCAGWSVKDIALHLLGGEVGILSRKRDHFSFVEAEINGWDDLVRLINDLNDIWIKATRRISPLLLIDLLRQMGNQTCEYFKSLDPFSMGDPVNWAGPEAAPVWLDLAREFTERWHHQQQIRDAVGKPGARQPRYFAPVLDAFVRALPHTYRDVKAEDDTLLALTITGESGGRWFLLRRDSQWNLLIDVDRDPTAEVVIDQETAWRLFTKGVSREEAAKKAAITGDRKLASKALEMISIIG